MYLFRGGDGRESGQSPEAMQEHMQKWQAWMEELGKQGKMEGGEPLETAGMQVSGKNKVVTDGPFAEAKEVVGGYVIVNTDTLEEAVELSKDCPILDFDDGHIEVRPIQKLEEMN